ncbi:hypothetical protein [Micromonospora sp. NPDC050200]|uniref:hypothetical protein n=1 Tax=Micromonospora sp. NPDC050200 TaxID=3155664 RepID=UPI0033FA8DDE
MTPHTPGSQALADPGHAPEAPATLTVDDRTHPLNVEGTPRLGRLPRDADPGETQAAYRPRGAGQRHRPGRPAGHRRHRLPGGRLQQGHLPRGRGRPAVFEAGSGRSSFHPVADTAAQLR